MLRCLVLQQKRGEKVTRNLQKEERVQILKEIAEYQMQILSAADKISCIEEKNEV